MNCKLNFQLHRLVLVPVTINFTGFGDDKVFVQPENLILRKSDLLTNPNLARRCIELIEMRGQEKLVVLASHCDT